MAMMGASTGADADECAAARAIMPTTAERTMPMARSDRPASRRRMIHVPRERPPRRRAEFSREAAQAEQVEPELCREGWVDPVFWHFNLGLDAGVLLKEVDEVAAVDEFERLVVGEVV